MTRTRHKKAWAAAVWVAVFFWTAAGAEEVSTKSTSSAQTPLSSAEIVRQSWKASHDGDAAAVEKLSRQMGEFYAAEAKVQALQLSSFPPRDQIRNFQTMNDVAVALFIKGEFLMHKGQNDEAKAIFTEAMEKYPWSQAWDPSRGSYWSVKEKSQASINVINGQQTPEEQIKDKAPKTLPVLAFPSKVVVVDYSQYGRFENIGTKDYHYAVTDSKGLAAAVGEAIYPNITDVYRDPAYKKATQEGRLEGSHWDFVNTDDLQAGVFKWVSAREPWGLRLFYIGILFEKAKMYAEAIKCYHAITVQFPDTMAWTYWQTPWYPGQAAIAKIHHIIRMHPELRLEYKGARIKIINSFDNDPKNDITITSPGVLRQLTPEEFAAAQRETGPKIQKSVLDWRRAAVLLAFALILLVWGWQKHRPLLTVLGIVLLLLGVGDILFATLKKKVPARPDFGKVVKTLGKGRVHMAKYENGHWQIIVDGNPYMIHGITYAPTKVGQSPDKGTLANWMEEDSNKNGLIDGPYEAFMDKNLNNKQDADEPAVGDFTFMKEMGVNTLRIYHQPKPLSKEFLRKMYKDHGFMVILGDYLGKYAIGSGASWSEGTDYENPEHRKNMMQDVKKMVTEFKDEPYVLMWLLGNENNYGVASNADKKPEAYYKFVNEVARMIKTLDSNHPVAICNGDTLFLDIFAKNAPDIDAYGANVYRGDYGFGSFWDQVAEAADRPAFISEYGAPAYGGERMTYEEAQQAQAGYHRGNWLDIQFNSAGYTEGAGNAVGGVAFEWLDEWWKNYEPSLHDTKADVVGPFPGGYYYEEWFGLSGQGDGSKSPFLREPRKVFDAYKQMWAPKP